MCVKRKKYPSRWCILSACLMLMCLTGTQYAFGLISDSIKDGYNLSQSQIDTIALFGNIGAYSGIIPGIFNNKFGPSISIWFAIIITTIGIALLTGITNKMLFIANLSTQNALIFGCLSNLIFNHGLAWLGTISAPTIVQNYPKIDHSKLLGIAKGYLGIGSAFIGIFKTNVADDNIKTFMISLLIFFPFSSTIFAYFLTILPNKNLILNYQNTTEMGYKPKQNKDTQKDGANFTYYYISAITFAVYLITMSLIQNKYDFNIYIRFCIFAVALLLYVSPWLWSTFFYGTTSIVDADTDDNNNQGVLVNIQNNNNNCNQPEQLQVGMPDIFKYSEFWMLYIVYAIVGGIGLTFINNISQIIESASSTSPDNDNENKNIATSLVTIISFGSFAGRTSGGYIAGKFNKYDCTFWLILCPLFMSISQIFLALVVKTNITLIFVGGVVTGYSFGWMFSLMIITISDIWGTKYLSGNYSLFDSASVFGGLIFATLIFGKIYDGFAIDNKCYGDKCYKYSFLICAFASVIAVILTIIVWRITVKKQKLKKQNIQPLLT